MAPARPDSTIENRMGIPVVNSIRLAWVAESDDALRDVGPLQTNFWDCRRSVPAARGDGSRDPRVAAADHRAATGQAQSGAIFGRRQDGSGLGLPSVSENPRSPCHRATGHCGPMASRRFPADRTLIYCRTRSNESRRLMALQRWKLKHRVQPTSAMVKGVPIRHSAPPGRTTMKSASMQPTSDFQRES
jgi:hypothetical protein